VYIFDQLFNIDLSIRIVMAYTIDQTVKRVGGTAIELFRRIKKLKMVDNRSISNYLFRNSVHDIN